MGWSAISGATAAGLCLAAGVVLVSAWTKAAARPATGNAVAFEAGDWVAWPEILLAADVVLVTRLIVPADVPRTLVQHTVVALLASAVALLILPSAWRVYGYQGSRVVLTRLTAVNAAAVLFMWWSLRLAVHVV